MQLVTACYCFCSTEFKNHILFEICAALQIRAGQWSLTANLWPLSAHIYHVMIMMTGGFSKKSIFIIFKRSRTQMFFKTGVIGNFAIFTGKKSVLESLFNKVTGLRPATLFQPRTKRDFNTGVFLWKLQTPFLMEHLRLLLLSVWESNCSIMNICQSFLNQKQKIWDGFY